MSLYNPTGNPTNHGPGSSAQIRSEFAAIAAAFALLVPPSFVGHAGQVVIVNAPENGFDATNALNGVSLGSTTPSTGAFTTLSTTGSTVLGDASADTLTVNATPNFLTNVGFNQATAAQHLHVGSGTLATEMIRFQTSGATLDAGVTASGFEFKSAAAQPFLWTNNNALRMTLDSSGNLGVGAAPASKFDVFGNYMQLRDGTYKGLMGRGSDLVTGGSTSDFGIRSDSGAILFATTSSGTEQMRITGSGVGIGGSPTAALEVARGAAAAAEMVLRGNGAAYSAGFSISSSSSNQAILFNRANTDMVFGTNNTEGMRLDSAGSLSVVGSVGIGTGGNSIIGALNVRQDSGNGPNFVLENRVVNASTHRYGALIFSPFRDVSNPVYGAAIWSEGGSGAGYDAALVFGTSINGAAATMPTERMRITASGVIQDANGNELGYKGLPVNALGAAYSIVQGDNGKKIQQGAIAVVNTATGMSSDFACVVVNTSGSPITIAQAASTTIRLSGTGLTGTRTLAAWATATITHIGGDVFLVGGAGVT